MMGSKGDGCSNPSLVQRINKALAITRQRSRLLPKLLTIALNVSANAASSSMMTTRRIGLNDGMEGSITIFSG
jgi:hypothetical protein